MAKHIENSQLMFVDGIEKEYFPSIFLSSQSFPGYFGMGGTVGKI